MKTHKKGHSSVFTYTPFKASALDFFFSTLFFEKIATYIKKKNSLLQLIFSLDIQKKTDTVLQLRQKIDPFSSSTKHSHDISRTQTERAYTNVIPFFHSQLQHQRAHTKLSHAPSTIFQPRNHHHVPHNTSSKPYLQTTMVSRHATSTIHLQGAPKQPHHAPLRLPP